MPAPNTTQQVEEHPIAMVGGSTFGRYNKISDSQTWNMIVSDEALVPYSGYKSMVTTESQAAGRGIYSSIRGNFMIAVIGDVVYKIQPSLVPETIDTITTTIGDVYISENNASQIVITDKAHVYVYDYALSTFTQLTAVQFPYETTGNPGYVAFQNGRILIAIEGTNIWALSGINDATEWGYTGSNRGYAGALQSKPDFIKAAIPVPGGGNNILVMGGTVAEPWQDVGAVKFPYQRSSSNNIDYGCLNASTISALNQFIVWLAVNEQSGPVIMVSSGNDLKSISTDGIDFKMATLTDPKNCTGFLFQQDGHLIYQFTFITDNLTYAYDFKSGLFFNISDPYLNYHPARQVVFFNNNYYFVSLNGGNVYELSTTLSGATFADGTSIEIPQIRITPPLRLPSQRYFIIRNFGFTIENGLPNTFTTTSRQTGTDGISLATQDGDDLTTQDGDLLDTQVNNFPLTTLTTASQRVDLSISRDGGETFGSSISQDMNPVGKRKSRMIFQRLGQANDATFQIRFYGISRFVVFPAVAEIYQ